MVNRLRQRVRTEESPYWFVRLSRPSIFLIIVLALVGAYLAFTIPIAVFPATNFPRIVIGIDNGVLCASNGKHSSTIGSDHSSLLLDDSALLL